MTVITELEARPRTEDAPEAPRLGLSRRPRVRLPSSGRVLPWVRLAVLLVVAAL